MCHSTLLRIASACVNVHNSLTIMKVNVWSVINNLGQAVSGSLQELVRASSSSMLVTSNNV